MALLLTRDNFRNEVFQRDGFKCVICKNDAQDAHHILERRLFPDGGYYIENGASLCGICHINAEKTLISVEEIREKVGIKKAILPPDYYPDQIYDKWGNPILLNKTRMRGELFSDESVQKILKEAGVMALFTNKVKYPRTWHLPWSLGATDDDRILRDTTHFEGKRVIVNIKLDGENCNLYSDGIHARSLDSSHHPSQGWVKNFWNNICQDIPENWRICGENLFARHSISYNELKSYFYGFSIWNERNECLDWDSTLEWFNLIGIEPVPVIYDGIFNKEKIKSLWNPSMKDTTEGYVVRLADSFSFSQFRNSLAKFVRKNHVQTSHHWKEKWVKNELKNS